MNTRKDYLNGICTHDEYYSQFVNAHTKSIVTCAFSMKQLKGSKDEHFNDIPLTKWDSLVPLLYVSGLMEDCKDSLTTAGGVCILTQATKHIVS